MPSTPPITRGPRTTLRIDLATAAWERNEFGVGVLSLVALTHVVLRSGGRRAKSTAA